MNNVQTLHRVNMPQHLQHFTLRPSAEIFTPRNYNLFNIEFPKKHKKKNSRRKSFSVLDPNAKTFKPISPQNIKSYKIAEKSYVTSADTCYHSDLMQGNFETNLNTNSLNPNAKIFNSKK